MKLIKYTIYALIMFFLLGVGINAVDEPATVGTLYQGETAGLTNTDGDSQFDWGVAPNTDHSLSNPDVFKNNPKHVTQSHEFDTASFDKPLYLRRDSTNGEQNGIIVNTESAGGGATGEMESPSMDAVLIGQDQALIVKHTMTYDKDRESKFFAEGLSIKSGTSLRIKDQATFMVISLQNNTRDGYLVAISSAGAGHLIPHNASAGVPQMDDANGTSDSINALNGELPIPYDLTVEVSLPDSNPGYPEWVKSSLGGLEIGGVGYIRNEDLKSGNYLLVGNIMSDARAPGGNSLNAIESISQALALGDQGESLSDRASKYVYNGFDDAAQREHSMSEAIDSDDLFHVVATNDKTSNYILSLGYAIHEDHRPYMQMAGTLFERIGVTYIDL